MIRSNGYVDARASNASITFLGNPIEHASKSVLTVMYLNPVEDIPMTLGPSLLPERKRGMDTDPE